MSQEQTELMLNPENAREREIMIVERSFALTQRQAKALASSNIVPTQFQSNVSNCMIAIEMADRLGTGVMEIMQNLYIVHGNPSFSAKYLIALVNNSGVLKGRLKFRFTGDRSDDTWGCKAYGFCADTGEELEGSEITIGLARAEGWTEKKGSKWKTMPEQMLMYRAAAFWSRIYAPDATMGMHSSEELQESELKDVTPNGTVGSGVASLIKEKKESVCDDEIVDGEVIEEQEQTPTLSQADDISDDELDGML